jgi:hypothetical protein
MIVQGVRLRLKSNIKWILEKLKGEKTIFVPKGKCKWKAVVIKLIKI